jgi:hypothetical protein
MKGSAVPNAIYSRSRDQSERRFARDCHLLDYVLGELFAHGSSEAIEQASATIFIHSFGDLLADHMPSQFVEKNSLPSAGRFECFP